MQIVKMKKLQLMLLNVCYLQLWILVCHVFLFSPGMLELGLEQATSYDSKLHAVVVAGIDANSESSGDDFLEVRYLSDVPKHDCNDRVISKASALADSYSSPDVTSQDDITQSCDIEETESPINTGPSVDFLGLNQICDACHRGHIHTRQMSTSGQLYNVSCPRCGACTHCEASGPGETGTVCDNLCVCLSERSPSKHSIYKESVLTGQANEKGFCDQQSSSVCSSDGAISNLFPEGSTFAADSLAADSGTRITSNSFSIMTHADMLQPMMCNHESCLSIGNGEGQSCSKCCTNEIVCFRVSCTDICSCDDPSTNIRCCKSKGVDADCSNSRSIGLVCCEGKDIDPGLFKGEFTDSSWHDKDMPLTSHCSLNLKHNSIYSKAFMGMVEGDPALMRSSNVMMSCRSPIGEEREPVELKDIIVEKCHHQQDEYGFPLPMFTHVSTSFDLF